MSFMVIACITLTTPPCPSAGSSVGRVVTRGRCCLLFVAFADGTVILPCCRDPVQLLARPNKVQSTTTSGEEWVCQTILLNVLGC